MLKRIFIVVILGALFFVGIQFASVFFYAWEFDDFVQDEVKYAPVRESSDKEHIVDHVVQQAHFYNLDLDKKDIDVLKHTDAGSGITTIEVDLQYTTPVDLYYFRYPIRRNVHAVTMY